MLSASPRTSAGGAFGLDDVDGLMVMKVSRRDWIWNVPGVSAVAMRLNVSTGETASEVADSRPILSQARYLFVAYPN
jgi:hypothetical protein